MSKHFKEPLPNINELSNYRIITKDLVYVIGLSENIAIRETLIRHEYFGQYGTIIKLIINIKKAYNQNSPHGPSYSAYVTYSKPTEASIAILSLDNTEVDNHLIRASFGTTKYCNYFLRNLHCTNKHCLYLHSKANESDIIKRDDLNLNQTIFYDQQLYAIKLADIYNPDMRKKLLSCKKTNTMFPSPNLIYCSEIVLENDPLNKKNKTITNSATTKRNSLNSITSNSNKEKNTDKKSNGYLQSSLKEDHDLLKSNGLKISFYDNDLTRSKEDILTGLDTTSDDKSKSTLSNSINNQFFHVPKIFESKDKSRFSFIQLTSSSECNTDDNEVPSFIQNIINKSTKLLPFTKNIKTQYDDTFIYLDNINAINTTSTTSIANNNLTNNNHNSNNTDYNSAYQWTQFLMNNKKYVPSIKHKHKYEDIFIQDFERINNFILSNAICK